MKGMGHQPKLERGFYQHYKGGVYEVLELACHTETLEWYVVYRSKKRVVSGMSSVWVRPYTMFVEHVIIDGEARTRFQKLEN